MACQWLPFVYIFVAADDLLSSITSAGYARSSGSLEVQEEGSEAKVPAKCLACAFVTPLIILRYALAMAELSSPDLTGRFQASPLCWPPRLAGRFLGSVR